MKELQKSLKEGERREAFSGQVLMFLNLCIQN